MISTAHQSRLPRVWLGFRPIAMVMVMDMVMVMAAAAAEVAKELLS